MFLVAIALAAALGGALVARHLGRAPALTLQGGTHFAEPRAVEAFQLTDQDGKSFGNDQLVGAPSLLFFGFTHCPDVCPTTLMEISQVFEQLGPQAKIRALFVTVDPERDTPELLKDYVSNFDPRIIGVTGPRENIDAALKAWRVFARKTKGEGDSYSMDHSSVIYLMDRQGRFATAFNLQQPAAQAARALRPYL